MANSERWGVTWVQVVLDGSGDHTLTQDIRLRSIKFTPSAANDVLSVAQVTPGVAEANYPRTKLRSASGDTLEAVFHSPFLASVLIDYSECVFGTVANAVITLEFE